MGDIIQFPQLQLPAIRHNLSYDDCLEDEREDYQNCSVLYCVTIVYSHMHTDMNSSYSRTVLGLGFVYVGFLGSIYFCWRVSYFVFCVFPLCCCLVVSTS